MMPPSISTRTDGFFDPLDSCRYKACTNIDGWRLNYLRFGQNKGVSQNKGVRVTEQRCQDYLFADGLCFSARWGESKGVGKAREGSRGTHHFFELAI